MPFSELIESEAPPEISLVYDELRTAIGIPVVNLIWRHLASLPDVLSWAWTTVRPVTGSTILAEGINQLEAIALKNVAHSAALFPAIPDDAMAVVETYNRGNCINLQLLTALRRAVAGEPTGNGGHLPIAVPLTRLPRIPVMPRMEALDPSVRAIVLDLAALHGAAKNGVVPSLYRHLALWPGLLPDLYRACAQLMTDGSIPRGREALLLGSDAISSRLLPALRPPNEFPRSQKPAVLRALKTFTGSLIAEMSMVGLLLRTRQISRTRWESTRARGAAAW
jgi:hypothetical protein